MLECLQKPWITQGNISSIKHRDYLFRVYKRSKLLTDFETYKQFRNRLTHVKDLAKCKYYEEQFAQNSRNSKITWKLINDIFSKTTPSSFPQRLKVDGRVYSSTQLIADALNQWFPTFFDAFLPLLIFKLFIPPPWHKNVFYSSPITRVCRNIWFSNIFFLTCFLPVTV